MVTTKQAPAGSTTARPKKRRMGGAGFMFMLLLLISGTLALGGLGIFVPVRLAIPQERLISLLHGGIADSFEETYVDGCVAVAGEDGLRAITRTRRVTFFRDGTTLEVTFSGRPVLTNACP
ncbi:MAG: hypothetical protein HC822_13485 [Oscillochloris sp.]|nr:hypothetical protein [Oscillochloris sp.]